MAEKEAVMGHHDVTPRTEEDALQQTAESLASFELLVGHREWECERLTCALPPSPASRVTSSTSTCPESALPLAESSSPRTTPRSRLLSVTSTRMAD